MADHEVPEEVRRRLCLVLDVVVGFDFVQYMVLPVVFLIFVLVVMNLALVFQNTIRSLTTATPTAGGLTTPRKNALPPYLVMSLLSGGATLVVAPMPTV